MPPVPLDEGPRSRGRYGIFWVEEGLGLVALGAVILVLVVALYILAAAQRPTAP